MIPYPIKQAQKKCTISRAPAIFRTLEISCRKTPDDWRRLPPKKRKMLDGEKKQKTWRHPPHLHLKHSLLPFLPTKRCKEQSLDTFSFASTIIARNPRALSCSRECRVDWRLLLSGDLKGAYAERKAPYSWNDFVIKSFFFARMREERGGGRLSGFGEEIQFINLSLYKKEN